MARTDRHAAGTAVDSGAREPASARDAAFSAQPRSVVDRVLSWLPVILVVLFAAMVFRARLVPANDPDTFWHLRLGTWLESTWVFVAPEPWSSLADRPLVLHEWAPQLLMAVTYDVGGYPALAWLQAVVAVVILVTLYLGARAFAPPLVSVIVALTGFGGASGSIALRPQIVTFVLVAVVTVVWLRSATDGRSRWWLIPLTWAWACSHGMWFVGTAIGAAVVVGAALDRSLDRRTLGRFGLVLLASVVAACLTPLGWRTVTTAGGMSAYTTYVAEWAAPSLLLHQTVLALSLGVVVVLVWLRRGVRVPWVEIAVWGVGVTFCLLYLRTIAIGAMVLTVLAAAVIGRLVALPPRRIPSRRGETLVLGIGLAATLVLLPQGSAPSLNHAGSVPVGLDDHLDALPDGTVVYNAYELGGWMLWRHPDLDPVIDGRADVYSVGHFRSVMDSYVLGDGWDRTVRESGADVAVLSSASPLAQVLVRVEGWTVVAEDDAYQLLEAPAQA